MLKNIIFDYMNVIADVDYKLLLSQLSLTDKIKALRLLVSLKTNKTMGQAFSDYQLGTLSTEDICTIASSIYPKSATVLPKFMELVPGCIRENLNVINLIHQLQEEGFKIVLISNSIPETQCSIENSQIAGFFDGFVLSNLVGLRKPDPEIYKFACETYGLKPEETLMVDDNPENLKGAKSIGLRTMLCKDIKNLEDQLGNYFYEQYGK